MSIDIIVALIIIAASILTLIQCGVK